MSGQFKSRSMNTLMEIDCINRFNQEKNILTEQFKQLQAQLIEKDKICSKVKDELHLSQQVHK